MAPNRIRNENSFTNVAKIAGLFSIAGWAIGASMSVTSFCSRTVAPFRSRGGALRSFIRSAQYRSVEVGPSFPFYSIDSLSANQNRFSASRTARAAVSSRDPSTSAVPT